MREFADNAAVDLPVLKLGLTAAWFNASPFLQTLADTEPTPAHRLAAHRAAVIAAVEAVSHTIGHRPAQ
ncbi:hypothetical protein GZH49_36420 [Nocardia terpenica]|uniref:hypothetical protein n=1 Tax=Nocardia terpenica TaxID=455432 RepID=UPI002FDF1EDA